MIPELGHFALIMALCLALVQAILPMLGNTLGIACWSALARPAAISQNLCLMIAFICLTIAFVGNDFSVLYVSRNSNSALPLFYRISAVWGAHEGSLLLWALALSIWSVAVSIFRRGIPDHILATVMSVLGWVSVGFLLFTLATSNPFERLFPVPADGKDLNPLLQDPGLALHPPMLYMGYVGFSVAFAFAIAALMTGKLDAAWARWVRPWTNLSWVFLTGGIALGSWWAYYELGWGGWWFWDPVENASFMPWLTGTALLHSLAVTEKRGLFKSLTIFLSIFTFSLSLLGTFLVRSGVLTSVHAFATDPGRGTFILVFLAIVVGGSLFLYALRAPQITSEAKFSWSSREAAILLNNVLLTVVCISILFGTLYPIAIDALANEKISVGPPYFNSIFIPLMLPLAAIVGLGAQMRWKKDDIKVLLYESRFVLLASIGVGAAMPWLLGYPYRTQAALGLVMALWVVGTTLMGFKRQIAHQSSKWQALMKIPRSFYGMSIAHVGIAVFIVGVTMTSLYSTEKDVRLERNDSYALDGYRFKFEGVQKVRGPNYSADEGRLSVTHAGQPIAQLRPQKRYYPTIPNPMTEAAIDARLERDLFVALGEPLGASGAWSLRLYVKPYIRLIWLGAIFMMVGGLWASLDRRYRKKVNPRAQ